MSDLPSRKAVDRFRWWALAVGVLTLASLTVYAARNGLDSLPVLGLAAVMVFSSKLLIFQGAIEGHPFSPWTLALIAWHADLVVSCLLLLWVARLEHLPLAGPVLRQAHGRAARTLETYPGLRRLAVSGVTFFVFLPLPGSGSVTGTLIGQLVGLSRPVGFLTVAVGTALAGFAYASVARYLGDQWSELIQSPLTLAASLLGLILFGWLAWRYVRRVLSEA